MRNKKENSGKSEKEKKHEVEKNENNSNNLVVITKNKKDKKNNKEVNKKHKEKKILTQEQKYKRKKFIKRTVIVVFIFFIILLVLFLISLNKWNVIIKDVIACENSVVLDATGNVIAVLGDSRIQKTVDLNEIPQDLKDAYISIEDKTFYKHNGINIKRTTGATLSYIINHGSSSFGGSTITQQLVKNITGENETSISRKIKEWDRAIKTELVLSKDEILELYLNIIYVGPNIYGVEMGSEYYFNKNVMDLDLAECAFLAGINNSPNSYNPFGETDNSAKIATRTKTVLDVMLDEGYITNDEYNSALQEVENGLNFNKGDIKPDGNAVYSYMVDATISDVISDLAEKRDISTEFATNYLYLAGLKIYSTQNSDIQKDIEEECEKSTYMLKSTINQQYTSQAAMVIIDHKSGQVVGCVGGLGKKETSRGFNRATQALRQTGSAIKPIAVLGPALEENIITPVTIYDDTLTTFADGYTPVDCEKELGNITVRRAVESSQNIPFVKMLEQLGTKKAMKYMEKEGITTLTEGDNNLSLALGGLEKGISPLEMAGAYATIANDGVYIEPIFYTRIENSGGKIILKNKQKSKRVYSEDTAYILKKLLTQPIQGENGTAKVCSIDGMEVAAKTGTTNDNYDKWLCGFTTYYTAVTWFGYDSNETINEGADSHANHLWSNVMNKVHKDLKKNNFKEISSVKTLEICAETGKIARSGCTNTYTEYFKKNKIIKDVCDVEHSQKIDNNNNNVNKNTNNSVNNNANNSVNNYKNNSNVNNSVVDNKNNTDNTDGNNIVDDFNNSNENSNTNNNINNYTNSTNEHKNDKNSSGNNNINNRNNNSNSNSSNSNSSNGNSNNSTKNNTNNNKNNNSTNNTNQNNKVDNTHDGTTNNEVNNNKNTTTNNTNKTNITNNTTKNNNINNNNTHQYNSDNSNNSNNNSQIDNKTN